MTKQAIFNFEKKENPTQKVKFTSDKINKKNRLVLSPSTLNIFRVEPAGKDHFRPQNFFSAQKPPVETFTCAAEQLFLVRIKKDKIGLVAGGFFKTRSIF